jgi:hypothetical protein
VIADILMLHAADMLAPNAMHAWDKVGAGAPVTPEGMGAPDMAEGTGAPVTPEGIGAPDIAEGTGTPVTPEGIGAPAEAEGTVAPVVPHVTVA